MPTYHGNILQKFFNNLNTTNNKQISCLCVELPFLKSKHIKEFNRLYYKFNFQCDAIVEKRFPLHPIYVDFSTYVGIHVQYFHRGLQILEKIQHRSTFERGYTRGHDSGQMNLSIAKYLLTDIGISAYMSSKEPHVLRNNLKLFDVAKED